MSDYLLDQKFSVAGPGAPVRNTKKKIRFEARGASFTVQSNSTPIDNGKWTTVGTVAAAASLDVTNASEWLRVVAAGPGSVRAFEAFSDSVSGGGARNSTPATGYYKTSPGETLIDTSSVLAAGFAYAGATNTRTDNTALTWWAGSSTVNVVNTGGSGATLNCTRTLSAPRAILGAAPSLLVPIWVEDFSKIQTISVRLSMGDTTFTNHFSYQYPIGPNGHSALKRNGWHLISIGATDWVSAGLPDWSSMTINAIRILFINATGQNNARIAIDDLLINNRAKANILLMTDRTFAEQYTFLRPLMQALDLKSTISVTKNDVGAPGKMTLAQISQMVGEGHALCVRNPSAMNTLTADQAVAQIASEQAYLRATFGAVGVEGAQYVTYASGIYYALGSAAGDMTIPNRLATELGVLAARTTDGTSQPNFLQLGADGKPPNLMVSPIIGAYTPNNSAAEITASINKSIDRSAACIFFLHAPTHTSMPSQEDVRQVFEHVAAKRAAGLIDVVTWPEFYAGLVAYA